MKNLTKFLFLFLRFSFKKNIFFYLHEIMTLCNTRLILLFLCGAASEEGRHLENVLCILLKMLHQHST